MRDTAIAKQKKLKRIKTLFFAVSFILVATVAYAAMPASQRSRAEESAPTEHRPRQVSAMLLNAGSQQAENIETSGTVKPATKIDVVAQGSGRVNNLFFETGDSVSQGQMLASLSEAHVSTTYQNTKTSFENLEISLEATKDLTEQTVRQAAIGVQNAEEAIHNAELGLDSAERNLENTEALLAKGSSDIKQVALVSFANHLSTVHATLDQINFIIKAEGNRQLDGISATLGIQNSNTVNAAHLSYRNANSDYLVLSQLKPNAESIAEDMQKIVTLLALTKKAVDDTVTVLDNTVASSQFSETSLNAQKTAITTLRSTIVSSQSSSLSTLQSLQNSLLQEKQQLDGLRAAIESAKSRLEQSRIAYSNALVAQSAAQSAQNQQLTSAKGALDNARGQMNSAGTQLADLSVRAPIRGQITEKYVEQGAEVSPGQRIAEISQTDLVVIEVALSPEDRYRVEAGQQVTIEDSFIGTITRIDPSADPFSRKITAEIGFDNTNKELIPETFVRITIPTKPYEPTVQGAYLVPLKAVALSQNDQYVFVVEDNTARTRNVVLGSPFGGQIEIISGLEEGDMVIISGNKFLTDGDPVDLQEEAE